MERNSTIPVLFIFGLDRVLWPFCIDYPIYIMPPFRIDRDGVVVDEPGRAVEFFAEVPDILERIHQMGGKMAVVSLTKKISETQQLLHLLGWDKYFTYKHLSPESTYFHFVRLQRISGIRYQDMVYYDYDFDSLAIASRLGVIGMVVREGMNSTHLEDSIFQYRILNEILCEAAIQVMRLPTPPPPPEVPSVPLLIAFSLDYVLWPFSTNTTDQVTLPFNKTSNGEVIDGNGKVVPYYEEVPRVLQELKEKKVLIAGVSRNVEWKIAMQLLEALGWREYMEFVEIYPGEIMNHFMRMHILSEIRYRNMLFFDNKPDEISIANAELGVLGTVTTKGMSLRILRRGITYFKKRRKLLF